ncbi:MAG: 4-hydroxybenzoyl-CoA reductase [Streptosporangiales bacterium]|nr:4-hydroxybenzoyl-CoA reductase [Streptosporangiales bacterium]
MQAQPSNTQAARTRFDAGRPCLNLLATIGRRGSTSVERIPAPADLATWLVDADLLDDLVPLDLGDLDRMRRLRDAAYAVVDAARHARTPAAGAVRLVNAAAAHPTPQLRLNPSGRTAARRSDHPVEAALAVLARDTIDLVTGPELTRVHECAATECRMLFLDTSRGTRRRWCSMTRCGNRAKVRTHAARNRQSGRRHDR